MLRFEIDGPRYRTTFFNMMLADYLRDHFSRKATSVDFIRAAEKCLGQRRADNFFRNWLYGWQVPSFTCRWSTRPDSDGHPYLDMTIDVADMPDDFETPFPVEIEFADGSREVYRLDGVGQQCAHTLGPFPKGIRSVIFNPDQILLAKRVEVIESQAGKSSSN
jgi:aminopeptidase N